MANGLPLDSYGNTISSIVLGSRRYTYRLYYTDGPNPGWLADFFDVDGNELATGVRLAAGSVNFLKGYSDAFINTEAIALTDGTDFAEQGMDAPDLTLFVNWYPDGETSGLSVGDPMDHLGSTYQILQS